MKRAVLTNIFLMIVFPACAGAGTAETASETAETTPITDASANVAECADNAAFVNDMTIPDGTIVTAGEPFLKVWRVENTGTCPWAERYTLVFVDGEQMGAPDSVPLRVTQPGETLDIAIDMTAPEIDGEYRADFEIHDPADNAIPVDNGTILWVMITVEAGTDE